MSIRLAPSRPASLYDDDFFTWTEQQAKLLRTLKNPPPAIDIENIAEEIETLGRSELHAVESQIGNIIVHLLKIVSAAASPAAAHWRGEIYGFHGELRRHFLPSMRQRIRLQQEWRLALKLAAARLEVEGDQLVAGLPKTCPIPLSELVGEEIAVSRLCELLRASM